MRKYRVDPYWGIPAGTPPLCHDPATGYVRPFSSYTTIGAVIDHFVGFSNEWFPPGEDHLVWVFTCGWVEMWLNGAQTVNVGDKFIPVDVGAISNNQVQPETLQVPGIFTAVENCWCQNSWVHRLSCPVAAEAADDTSETSKSSELMEQRTVILQFGDCCNLVSD